LVRTEASIQVQLGIALVMTVVGIWVGISPIEWAIQFICIGVIMGLEGMNTAMEYMADFVHPDHHEKIGLIKDVAAGAVMIFAFAAMIVGGMIYTPYLISYLEQAG
jgi:Diacylglycerol kinase